MERVLLDTDLFVYVFVGVEGALPHLRYRELVLSRFARSCPTSAAAPWWCRTS